MSNTTPKDSNPSDPFWEKTEGLFLQVLFYYVWLELSLAELGIGVNGDGKRAMDARVSKEVIFLPGNVGGADDGDTQEI